MFLKKGYRNNAVKELQIALNILGAIPKLIVDGDFGKKTYDAVLDYQKKNFTIPFEHDGIVGNKTWFLIQKQILDLPSQKKELPNNVIEINPLDLKLSIQDKRADRIDLNNFITSGYQWHHKNGVTYPLSMMVSEGKIIHNGQPHGKAAGTLIVYKDGSVNCKPILDITKEKNVWFAVGGCSIYPQIRMKEEGFVGNFSDIGRTTDRPMIGYRKQDNKIIIASFSNCNIGDAHYKMKNLGCDYAITLDAGGSNVLRNNGEWIYKTTRRLYLVITW